MTLKMRFFLTLTLVLAMAAGCGKSSRTPCTVSGKVSYKGEVVGGGTISFYPKGEEQGGGYGFPIKADGTYDGTTSMPAGDYEVAIETESANKSKPAQSYGSRGGGKDGKMTADSYKEKMMKMGKAPQSTEPQGKYVKIPAKYNDKAKSGLTVTLTNGKNKKDFDLTD